MTSHKHVEVFSIFYKEKKVGYMRLFFFFVFLLLVTFSQQQELEQEGICILQPVGRYPTSGIVTFSTNLDTNVVTVDARIENVISATRTQSIQAMHIHEKGDVSSFVKDGLSTGGHFDPDKSGIHATPTTSTPHHAGDMGNFNVSRADTSEVGTIDQQLEFSNLFSLKDRKSIIGRSVVLHINTDDYTNTNNGNAGARISICVIGKRKPTRQGVINTAVADRTNLKFSTCEIIGDGLNSGRINFEKIDSQRTRVTANLCTNKRPSSSTTLRASIYEYGDLSGVRDVLQHMGDAKQQLFSDLKWKTVGNQTSYVAYTDFIAAGIPLDGDKSVLGQSIAILDNQGDVLGTCVIGVTDSFNSFSNYLQCNGTPESVNQDRLFLAIVLSSFGVILVLAALVSVAVLFGVIIQRCIQTKTHNTDTDLYEIVRQ